MLAFFTTFYSINNFIVYSVYIHKSWPLIKLLLLIKIIIYKYIFLSKRWECGSPSFPSYLFSHFPLEPNKGKMESLFFSFPLLIARPKWKERYVRTFIPIYKVAKIWSLLVAPALSVSSWASALSAFLMYASQTKSVLFEWIWYGFSFNDSIVLIKKKVLVHEQT